MNAILQILSTRLLAAFLFMGVVGAVTFNTARAQEADSNDVFYQSYIHSTLGFSYLTLHVTDLSASIKRLEKAGIELLADTPVPIGSRGNQLLTCRDPDGNFIELIGPR